MDRENRFFSCYEILYKKLEKAFVEVLLTYPKLGASICGIPRQVTEEIPTACVAIRNRRIFLLFSPHFVDQLTDEQLRSVVIHEVYHLLFGHHFRHRLFEDKVLFNIACDLVVNFFVCGQLPEGSVTIEALADLRLRPNQTVGYYYLELQKHGHASVLAPFLRDGSLCQTQHRNWATLNQIDLDTGVDNTQIMQETYKALEAQDQKDCWGDEVGNEEFRLGNDSSSSSLNWDQLLQETVINISSDNVDLAVTTSRPSKRYPNSHGVRLIHQPSILVALDVSRSITNEPPILELLANQIEQICIATPQTEIHVVTFDAEVRDYFLVQKGSDINNRQLAGGGGTSYDCIFDFANEDRMETDLIVILTDGVGSKVETAIRCPVIWLISPSPSGAEPGDLDLDGTIVKL